MRLREFELQKLHHLNNLASASAAAGPIDLTGGVQQAQEEQGSEDGGEGVCYMYACMSSVVLLSINLQFALIRASG